MTWTPERIERLTHLWNELGWSASMIARDLRGVTRSAVIGKAHRLRLNRRPPGFNHLVRLPHAKNRNGGRRRAVPRPAPLNLRPAPPKPTHAASDRLLIDAALEAGKIIVVPSEAASGLSVIEQQFWAAAPVGRCWRRAA